MKIISFNATQVHGYLDLEATFLKDLTFLTGINGSGKTTVIQCITALISPDISSLISIIFEKMDVALEHDGQLVTISAQRDIEHINIETSATEGSFTAPFEDYQFDEFDDPRRKHLALRNLSARMQGNSVIEYIQNLPSPMILGLERTSLDKEGDRFLSEHQTRKRIFKGTLSDSLHEAIDLARGNYLKTKKASDFAADSLRKNVAISMFEVPPSKADVFPTKVPAKSILGRYQKIRRDIGEALVDIDVSDDKSKRIVDEYFDDVIATISKLPFSEKLEDVLNNKNIQNEKRNATFQYIQMSPQIKIIQSLAKYADEYRNRKAIVWLKVNLYLDVIKRFLIDTNKTVSFSFDGTPSISISSEDGEKLICKDRDMFALSSGERQIFVILTHLAFNKLAREANVLIIDEPELSLHVRWQELFVDACSEINPDLQLIFATHSPSIIQGRTNNCITAKK
ncbi:AAA family ATPase [Pseudomonadota bacterium]